MRGIENETQICEKEISTIQRMFAYNHPRQNHIGYLTVIRSDGDINTAGKVITTFKKFKYIGAVTLNETASKTVLRAHSNAENTKLHSVL